jgi:hypothetical protein
VPQSNYYNNNNVFSNVNSYNNANLIRPAGNEVSIDYADPYYLKNNVVNFNNFNDFDDFDQIVAVGNV